MSSAPPTPNPSTTLADSILTMIDGVLVALEGILPGAAFVDVLVKIAQKAAAGYESRVGKPIDPTLLKPIDPLP
jgi:hypothetical protein